MTGDFDWIPKRITREGYRRLDADQMEDVRRRLRERHPDDHLTAVEAAIYCGVSTRTIKRAIDAGKGPERQKNPDSAGSGAVNRHTKFRKAGLDAWTAAYTSFESFTGRFSDFDDLVREEPWVMDGTRVVAHLLDVGTMEALMDILAGGEVEFLRLDEALASRWQSLPLRNRYAKEFKAVMERTQADIHSAGSRDALDVQTSESSNFADRRVP